MLVNLRCVLLCSFFCLLHLAARLDLGESLHELVGLELGLLVRRLGFIAVEGWQRFGTRLAVATPPVEVNIDIKFGGCGLLRNPLFLRICLFLNVLGHRGCWRGRFVVLANLEIIKMNELHRGYTRLQVYDQALLHHHTHQVILLVKQRFESPTNRIFKY